MGKLQEIRDAITKALPSTNTAIFPNRGPAFPLDPFGRGVCRFGRMLGDTLPCFFAENSTTLAINLQQNNTVAVLADTIPWVTTLSLLRFPATGELLFAQDSFTWGEGTSIVEEAEGSQAIRLELPALGTHTAGSVIELFAHPTTFEEFVGVATERTGLAASTSLMQAERTTFTGLTGMTTADEGKCLAVTGAASAGNNGVFPILAVLSPTSAQVLNVNGAAPDANNGALAWAVGYPEYSVTSTQPLYPGDRFWRGYVEYDVRAVTVAGPVPPTDIRYFVTLTQLLPSIENGAVLYLRAYPAYCSAVLPIPEMPYAQDATGPGLLDWISGPVVTDFPVQEVTHLRTYDGTLTTILEDWTEITKNHVLLARPIAADAFLFFRPTQGEINWDGRRWVTRSDVNGQFHAVYKCVPELPAVPYTSTGPEVSAWNFRAQADKPGVHISIDLEPGVRISATLPDTSEWNVSVPVTEGPITAMHVAYQSDEPETKVRFTGWQPNKRIVQGVQLVTVARVTGRWEWATSTALYKPYWLRLEYLRVYQSRRDRLDGGLLLL